MPNKTQISEKKYEAIINHAYKRSKKTQIIFIDRTDHKLTIHRIPTNTPQKRVTSNRSPRDHCIENKKERRSQLVPTDPYVYDELLTHHRKGTNEDDEPLRDGV